MSVILITTLFYKALISQGEIWCWSLLGLKGLTKPRSPILNSGSSIIDPWSWFSSTPWSLFFFSSTEVSNQHVQAIEFVDQPVPEKLNMGFLLYGYGVLQVVCVVFKYKATRNFLIIKHICDTYITSDR